MQSQETAPAPLLAVLAAPQGRRVPRLWVILAGALIVLAALTMLVGLWPQYQRLANPCPPRGPCFVSSLTLAEATILGRYGLGLEAYAGLVSLIQFVTYGGFLGVAVVLFWRQRDDPMAICTVYVMTLLVLTMSGYLTAVIDVYGPWSFLIYTAIIAANGAIILFFALFPSGSFVPRALRWYTPLLILLNTVVTVAVIAAGDRGLFSVPYLIMQSLWMVSMLVAQSYRYLCVSSPAERRQTQWVVGVLIVFMCYKLGFAWFIGLVGARTEEPLALLRVVLLVLLHFMELAIVVGVVVMMRRGLYNLERLAGRTVVYALLTVCVAALYVLLVGGISLLLRPASNAIVALLATGTVAVAFQPLRAALQRGVNQLLYGRRDEPYQVLELLGQRLAGALAPQDMLPTVAATVRAALRLPYVAVTRDDWEGEAVVSVSGEYTPGAVAFPLVVQHEQIGRLIVAPRSPGEPFSAHERRLLATLAQHISIAAHAARLTDDLQRSRERLVTAREEERRRLQRDLHDELGPTLASLSMQLDAARAQLADDPAAGEALLAEVQDQLRQAIGTVRQIVHQLRPPILDQLGLRGAITECALRVERGTGLRINLELPANLPPVSAAVEAAAYYIVAEALNNAARHARARNCTVRLLAGSELRIEVSDDGIGLPAQAPAGVGLRSMRERALELGGSWQIASAAGEGTTVRAGLPLTGKAV